VTLVLALPEGIDRDGIPEAVQRWAYVGDDSAWRINAESGVLRSLPRIATAEMLQEAAWRLRRPYLDWVGSLAEDNDSLEWWSCELAARNSYTRLYERVCSLAVAQQLIGDAPEDTLLVCGTPALLSEAAAHAQQGGRAIRVLAPTERNPPRPPWRTRVAREVFRIVGGSRATRRFGEAWTRSRRVLDGTASYRRAVLRSAGASPEPFEGEDSVLLFTWIDDRNFGPDGSYRDPHLGSIPELFRKSGRHVRLLARILPGVPFAATVHRLLETGEDFLFPDSLLTADDEQWAATTAATYTPRVPGDATVAGVPTAALALEHHDEHREAHRRALLNGRLVPRFAQNGISPERTVITYEGHAWEQALLWSTALQAPKTMLVGYENVNMTRLALSMYQADAERPLRPVPDRIVTNGPAFRDVLLSEGTPPERVRSGCAIRHASLWDAAASTSRPRTPGDHLRVLVATDGALGAAVELIRKAFDAIAIDERFEIVVKCHPNLDAERVRALAGGPPTAYSNEPIQQLLQHVDAMLYTYSVVAYEALALGVPPVFVRAETALDLDQLEPFRELRQEARTPTEIHACLEAIATSDPSALESWRVLARDAAKRALAPVDDRCIEAFL
jgi:hypothetical protein